MMVLLLLLFVVVAAAVVVAAVVVVILLVYSMSFTWHGLFVENEMDEDRYKTQHFGSRIFCFFV